MDQKPSKSIQNVSIIWKAMGLAFPLVGNLLVWKVGREKFKVGIDPWVGRRVMYKLPNNLIATLQRKGNLNLAQATLQSCPLSSTKSGKMQIN
jgi:hypothetical protein